MVMDRPANEIVDCRSLKEDAWNEACAEKYYRSRDAGRDLGEQVIREWVRKHWEGFVRVRWLEHMCGVRKWIELDSEEFGMLRTTPVGLQPLLGDIIGRLICGAENLDILVWARCKSPDERKSVSFLLNQININSRHLRCYFSDD